MVFDKNEYTEIDDKGDSILFAVLDGIATALTYMAPAILAISLFI